MNTACTREAEHEQKPFILVKMVVLSIKIVKCDENSLHLDFKGETRVFEKQSINLLVCKRFVREGRIKCKFWKELTLKGGTAYDG